MKYKWPTTKREFDLRRMAARDKYAPLLERMTSVPELYGLWDEVAGALEAAVKEAKAEGLAGPDPGASIGKERR